MREALQARMLELLPHTHKNPLLEDFYQLIRDYPQRSGKLIRGQLLLLSYEAHGGIWRDALDVAAALELFQNWVLIHDDIEDDSEERRGKPALHHLCGMPIALNVGDALHVYMWQALHNISFAPDIKNTVLRIFQDMISRTAEGQHLDLSWIRRENFEVSEADYLEMVSLKTAHYTVISPLQIGACLASHPIDERLERAGLALGIAFQIRDDVLNLLPEVSYGKEFAGDLYEAKRTLILAHCFAQADSAERAELMGVLSKARANKTPQDIDRILAIIDKHQSIAYAQSFAQKQTRLGLDLIRNYLQEQRQADRLLALLETLVTRLH